MAGGDGCEIGGDGGEAGSVAMALRFPCSRSWPRMSGGVCLSVAFLLGLELLILDDPGCELCIVQSSWTATIILINGLSLSWSL